MKNNEMCKGSESRCGEPRDVSPIMNAVSIINEKFDKLEQLQYNLTERLSVVLADERPEEDSNVKESEECDVALLRDLERLMFRIDRINDRFRSTLDRLAL